MNARGGEVAARAGDRRSSRPRFTALILAGSRNPADPVAALVGAPAKAVVPVAGRAMVLRVVDALRGSQSIDRVALALDPAVDPESLPELAALIRSGSVIRTPTAASPSLSVIAALETLASPTPMLVTTADHALLSPAMIDHFLDTAHAGGCDLAVALATRRVIESRYPQARRTYLHFKGEAYSGCNLFAIMIPDGARAAAFWARIEGFRKRPWRLALAIGPMALILFLSRQLDLAAAMRRLSVSLGMRVEAVTMPFAEAAIDIDKPEDLELAEAILQGQAKT